MGLGEPIFVLPNLYYSSGGGHPGSPPAILGSSPNTGTKSTDNSKPMSRSGPDGGSPWILSSVC